MGRRIQARLLLLMGLGAIGPAAGLAWAIWNAQSTLDRELQSERDQRAAAIASRLDDRLAIDLERLEEGVTQGRRSLIAGVETVDASQASSAAITRTGPTRARAVVPIRRWDGTITGGIAADLELSPILRGAVLSEKEGAPLTVARFRVSVPEPAAMSAFSSSTLIFAVLAFAVSLLFAVGAARSVTRPLRTLTDAAQRISAGDLSTPIPPLPSDEVGRLGLALDLARRELERRVAERTASVRRLLAEVIDAQEHERRRVARELHDETCQSLAALALQLRASGRAELAPQAEQALDALHRLIADLRPGVLDDLGLKSAILWLADRLESSGVTVRCEFAGLDHRLTPQVETTVFRAVQEAVHNIERHAHAGNALIQAAEKDGRLQLDVEDDGKGFDTSAFARPYDDGRGWGLLGMRERVEMLGGTFRVDSAPGEGTRVELSVPVGEA